MSCSLDWLKFLLLLQVKRGSCFYHLPDSLSLKHVFQGFQDTWILYVNASLSDFNNCTRVSQNITDSRSNRQKKFCSKGVALKPTLAATAFKQNKRKRKRKRQSLSEESQSSKAVVLGPVQLATAYPLRKKHKRKKRPIVKKLHLDSVKTEGTTILLVIFKEIFYWQKNLEEPKLWKKAPQIIALSFA